MESFSFLVAGAGIAGLRAAISLAGHGSVLVVTKEALAESNTAYAQGGIAVAMGGSEDVALHLEDTLAAGDGLVNEAAARVLVEQGPARVAELLEWGTKFDREGGELMRTREGAHSLSRILHANGDATGREIATSLLRHVRSLPNITLREWTTVVDLLVISGRVVGATLLSEHAAPANIYAGAVLLATGGAGQVFSDTTNPQVATGDGIAAAYRAGAAVMDMEFYQFHPTAFSHEGAPRFLLSEALRGEGAYLVNARGERFMSRHHKQLELAPRDVVARAITYEALDGPVYLDMRHVDIDLAVRFPGISNFLARYGLQLNRDLIPVRPAAHYMMGGVKTGVSGRTTLPGLYAAGEIACTGVHGANRLASNSLLEGLVFGAAAAEAMISETSGKLPAAEAVATSPEDNQTPHDTTLPPVPVAELEAGVKRVQALMWKHAGLLRGAAGLEQVRQELQSTTPVMLSAEPTRFEVEARNLHLVAELMVVSALAREESRGAHFRNDFPQKQATPLHSILERGSLSFEA